MKDKVPPKDELPEPVSPRWVTTGAFDPATATGYLDSPYTGLRPMVAAGFEHERLVNGVRYIGTRDGSAPDNGKIVWSRYPGKQDNLDYELALGGGLTASADPQELFRALRRAGAKVTETPGGAPLRGPGEGRSPAAPHRHALRSGRHTCAAPGARETRRRDDHLHRLAGTGTTTVTITG